MTKYLGIDYGRKHLGLAISDGILAEPLRMPNDPGLAKAEPRAGKCQITPASPRRSRGRANAKCGRDGSARAMVKIVEEIKPEEIVIGVSEGEMAKETREFGALVKKETKLPVIFWDETLTTQEAVKKMVESGMAKGRRKKMDHAAAAALILQSYLDQNGIKKT
ncbi:MAG: Holliday junction resolvase RuvX [bacterium]|nr:Holliday junction resolvase RuvX [bacterium]